MINRQTNPVLRKHITSIYLRPRAPLSFRCLKNWVEPGDGLTSRYIDLATEYSSENLEKLHEETNGVPAWTTSITMNPPYELSHIEMGFEKRVNFPQYEFLVQPVNS